VQNTDRVPVCNAGALESTAHRTTQQLIANSSQDVRILATAIRSLGYASAHLAGKVRQT